MVLPDRADLATDIAHPPEFSRLEPDALRNYADGFASVSVEVRPRDTVDRAGAPAVAHDLVLLARR